MNDDDLGAASSRVLSRNGLIAELAALDDETTHALALLVACWNRMANKKNQLKLSQLVDHREKGEGAHPTTMPERSFAFCFRYLSQHAGRSLPDHRQVRLVAIALRVAPTDDRVDRWKRIVEAVRELSFDPNDISATPVEAAYLAGIAIPLASDWEVKHRQISHEELVAAVQSK